MQQIIQYVIHIPGHWICYNEFVPYDKIFRVKFMEQENQRSLIEFWLATQNFHDKLTMLIALDSYDGVQAQNDAMVLYDK